MSEYQDIARLPTPFTSNNKRRAYRPEAKTPPVTHTNLIPQTSVRHDPTVVRACIDTVTFAKFLTLFSSVIAQESLKFHEQIEACDCLNEIIDQMKPQLGIDPHRPVISWIRDNQSSLISPKELIAQFKAIISEIKQDAIDNRAPEDLT